MIDCKTFITPIDNFFIEIWTKRYFHLNGCRKNVIFYQRGWQAINVWSNHRTEHVNAIILSKLSIFRWPYFSSCNKIGYCYWPNSVILYIYIKWKQHLTFCDLINISSWRNKSRSIQVRVYSFYHTADVRHLKSIMSWIKAITKCRVFDSRC